MKPIEVFSVRDVRTSAVHLETLRGDEAVSHAQALARASGTPPEITAVFRVPADYTLVCPFAATMPVPPPAPAAPITRRRVPPMLALFAASALLAATAGKP
jgi:hypothetical protein